MDAIECGIVKLPRVPVADNLPGASADDMPMFRNIWEYIRTKMPKKGRGKSAELDPLSLPTVLMPTRTSVGSEGKQKFQRNNRPSFGLSSRRFGRNFQRGA
jgi:hypothetical protein